MKKISNPLYGLMLLATFATAQEPANRTPQTIVADVLAQVPLQEPGDYNKAMESLAGNINATATILIDMLNEPGKGSNASVDFALNGMTNFISTLGEDACKELALTMIAALEKEENRELKAHIIRQLHIVASDESVEALSGYLNTEELSGPASRALASIGTPSAEKALMSSLMRRMGTEKTQRDAIIALGELGGAKGAEDLLLSMLNTDSEDMKKSLFYALGTLGTEASLPALRSAANAANYTMEPSGANEAYFSVLRRLIENGETAIVAKEAKAWNAAATKLGAHQSRIASLQMLLMTSEGEQKNDLIIKALKDKCMVYRNAALTFASCFADATLYAELLGTMPKMDTATQIDVLSWFSREADCTEKRDMIYSVEVPKTGCAFASFKQALGSPVFEVRQAAAWTLVSMKYLQALEPLCQLLESEDKANTDLALETLLAFDGYVADEISMTMPKASESGQIAALTVLGNRKASQHICDVLALTKSQSAEVKAKAYATLAEVASSKDFANLCTLLEDCKDKEQTKALQLAVQSSLSEWQLKQQSSYIQKRMKQVGKQKEYLYYPVLASTGDVDALKIIINGYRQGEGEIKDAAFTSLVEWNGTESMDELYRICQTESSSNYFDEALSAYIKRANSTSFPAENRLLGLRKAMAVAKTDQQKTIILRSIGGTNTFLGLLFAGNYLGETGATQQAAAVAVKNIALANSDYTGKEVRELLEKVMPILNNSDADYQRQEIRDHLSKINNAEGYESMFNGVDLTGWKGLVANPIKRAQMSSKELAKAQAEADEIMKKEWVIEDGALAFVGESYRNLCTEKQYGNFEMYVDWRLDPAGREPDAGIYLRGTPQVQIWDISRTNVGAQVGSGGLYNNQKHAKNPSMVADNKMGEWNSLYIKMVGDRVTVKLNGHLVVDNVIMENFWDRKSPIFPVEQIELQAHGSKVWYRDLYIKELPSPEAFELSAEEKKDGFKVLFDGTNMHNWQGNTVDYALDSEGCIALNPNQKFGGNLYTKEQYGDFVFRFEFQLPAGCNNGLGIRTPMNVDAAYHGMELQILDNDAPIYKNLKEYQYHGSVYGIKAAKRGALKPVGEWNYQEVIADGDNIKITLNGEVIIDTNLKEATKNGTADKKEHPGLFNKKGFIGFLGHGSPIKFRNVRIKTLD